MSSQSIPTAPAPAGAGRSDLPSTRFGGLDGLRAIAVGLVLAYHFFPASLPGGFLGVDIFFVISGFLITSLLLRERQRHGRISLIGFWRRRARRLLPPLVVVLLACTTFALLVAALGGGDLLVHIWAQLAGALLFVSNWVYIALGGDYFTRDNPELYRNTWSLSIEEQFYVVLPLLLLLALRAHSRITRSLLFILLAAGSAALMVLYLHQGESPTRIYFGSDSHVFGLFAGVALAVLLQPVDPRRRPGGGPQGVGSQLWLILLATAGLSVLGWQAATLVEGSPESFAGGFQLASAAALLVVWAVSRPGAWAGRALDVRPLRWIGERSYGIYLWHWPLLLIVPGLVGGGVAVGPEGLGDGVAAAVVAWISLILSVALAAASYRFIERPVRRHGLRGSFRSFNRAWATGGARRATAATVTLLVVVGLVGTGTAVAVAPSQSSAAAAIQRGQEAMIAQQRADLEAAARAHGVPGMLDGLDGDVEAPSGPPVWDGEFDPDAIPPGRHMFAVGDSVMLASLPELKSSFPGIRVDAAVSRGIWAGIGIVQQLEAQGGLRPVLVVGLGTNGPVDAAQLDDLAHAAGPRAIVLVNAHADRPWIPGVNKTLAKYARAHAGVVLADWDAAIRPYPERLAGDGIHPNPSGAKIYAKTVRTALIELQDPAEQPGLN